VRAEVVRLFDCFLVTTGVATRRCDRGERMAAVIAIVHNNVSTTKHQRNRDSERGSDALPAMVKYLMRDANVRQTGAARASVHV
jgi:hypothetical protein